MFFKKLINKGINKGYEADQCELCHLRFNLLKFDRIHKCKRCFKYVCQTCGDYKEYVIDEEGNRTVDRHRVCRRCKLDIDQINDTIAKYEMRWDSNSKLASEWIEKIRKKDHREYEYQHFLNYFHRSGRKFIQEIEIIEKDVIRGRTDFSVFNYSMKEFFYTMQENVEDQHITRINIANVLYGVAARYDRVGYCQGMSGIAALLLCFAEEETSYYIFCDLIENIFPPMFFERNSFGVPLIGLLAEIHFLKEYYWMFVLKKKPLLMTEMEDWFTEEEEEHTKMVIELAGTKALLSVFIGVLNFTNLIFVWEELKTHRNFEVIEKAFLAIIYLNRHTIIEERSFKKLQQYFQKCDHEVFMQAYHDIDIDAEARTKLTLEFYQQNKSKWSTSKTGNAYTLSKVTNLTEEEIKLFQKLLCPNFSNEDFISKSAITLQQFQIIISIYYRLLKNNSDEGDQILEMTPVIIRKIFKSYSTNPENGQIFRQFIRCFSICTKGTLKDRIIAIVTTCESNQNEVSYQNLLIIVSSLIKKSTSRLHDLQMSFMQRVKQCYGQNTVISVNQLGILLNDLFINELSYYLRSSYQNIVREVIQEYKIVSLEKEQNRQTVQEKMMFKDLS